MDPPTDDTDGREDVDMLMAPAAEPQEEDQNKRVDEGDSKAPLVSDAEPGADLPLRNDIPPLEQQVKTIETLVKAFAETPLEEGQQAFLVSRKWLNRAQTFGADARHNNKQVFGRVLGPVDNSDIIEAIFTDSLGQACVQLRPGMGSESFELFPKDAWDLLVSWYGLTAGQSPVIRTAHNTAPDNVSPPNIQFEFYPPVFTIHRLWSATSPIPIEQELKQRKPAPPIIVQSTSFGYHNFLKQAKQLAGVANDRKVRVWRILQTLPTAQPAGALTPPDSAGGSPDPVAFASAPPVTPGAYPELLVDVEKFLHLQKDVERGLVEADDTTTNPNYNGRKSLSLVGLTVDSTLILDESIDRDTYVSTHRGSNNREGALATRGSTGNLVAQTRVTASGRNSPALAGPLTRGRAQQKSGRTIGCCGLQNLGNTCYMNSALQCLRSVEELTKYFLTHEAEKEINTENPLSHNGEVAMAYGRLLEEMYKDRGQSSIQPRQFKSVIGRHAATFSGYGQQDSQEFLGFLLDGLQEDLNRVKKKPYIEKPDSTDDMIHNNAAIREMAEKVWDITKKRDDSVIGDLFTGLYKSTLVCPACKKVSITFDPFTNLTLPLPVGNVWSRPVKFFPLTDWPFNLEVEISKNATVKELKQFVSDRVGVPVERLFAAEAFRDRFYKFYDETSCVADEMQTNDHVTVHELEACPTNAATAKTNNNKKQKYRSLLAEPSQDDGCDEAERILVPVVHRLDPGSHGRKPHFAKGKQSSIGVPDPHFIVLTRDEAQSEDIIRRKVLEKVATYSTWPVFWQHVDAADNSESTTDPEMVNANSDADSAGDAGVVAKSLQGEEDIIDVTMSDAAAGPKDNPPSTADQYPNLIRSWPPRPRVPWVNAEEFLDAQLQNLFQLSYFDDGSGSLACGWQVVTEDGQFPRLSTRQPKPASPDVDMRSPGPWDASDDTGSEGQSSNVHEQTRMADESDDDSDPTDLRQLSQRHPSPHLKQVSARGRGKKMKPYRTYGKKGKKRLDKQQQRAATVGRPDDAEPESPSGKNNGLLVRPGEGIVVDWDENAFDMVFGGSGAPGDERGVATYSAVETLHDRTIEASKARRLMRQKHGITLDDCLAEFEKPEVLSEQDTWYCPRCKDHRRATKKFDLWKTPDILVVHLKRFSSNTWTRNKIDTLVDFPVEGLDLTKRVIDKTNGKEEIFDLIAVDNHWGGLGGGHYTASAKNFVDGEWYEYNDASVSKTKDPQRGIVTPGAYLLFYRRRSEVPLGGPRFAEIFEHYNVQTDAGEPASGEGQRLGQGSSLGGSPSASTGAGPAHRRAARGFLNDIDDSVDGEPPAYRATLPSESRADEADGDADRGVALTSWTQQGALRNSIEADEGIDMPEYDNAGPAAAGLTSMLTTDGWSFGNLKQGSDTGADDDLASDVAQGDGSSMDGGSFADGMDTEPNLPEQSLGYIGQAEPIGDFPAFDDPPAPVPRENSLIARMAVETWESKVYTVPADVGHDQPTEQVAEIRIDDDHEHDPSQEQQQNPKA